jgi:phosphoglycolate phosphatase
MTAAITPLSGVKAAIVDLDGTMLDTVLDIHAAINMMRADLELGPMPVMQIRDMIGKGSEKLVRDVLAIDYDDAGVEQRFGPAFDAYQRHYETINGNHSTHYPDVATGLQALQDDGLRLACVTNKPIALARPLLEQKGLAHFFDVIYGGDSLPKKKPHPMPLLQVCEDFALAPREVVAIGDSSNDAQAARAAGCPVLTVPYGYNHGESIHETDSDGIVDTLLHAAKLIRLHNPNAN